MAASLKIFIALIVTSIVKDGAHSCTLRSHKTSPPPCPTDHPGTDAIPEHLHASAPCAQPAPGPQQHQLSDAPTNAITSNSPGSNSIPLHHHRSTAVALSSPFPEPSVTPVPNLDFERFLVYLQRHFSPGPTPVVTSPPAPVPSGPAKFAQFDQTAQIERLLTLLLSTPGIVAVPSPAAAAPTAVPATGPAEPQPQTVTASNSPAPALPPADPAPIDAAAPGPAAVASASEFPPIVVAPAAPNIPQDAVAAPSSSQSTPLQSTLSPSTPPSPPPSSSSSLSSSPPSSSSPSPSTSATPPST